MIATNTSDFSKWRTTLKANYRKGVHAFRAVLAEPTLAAEFAANLGGVCVVLGPPVGKEDRNSAELRELLLGSDAVNPAALTWLSQWFPEHSGTWDALPSDAGRTAALIADPYWRRVVTRGRIPAAKIIATTAGLDCSDFADAAALAASAEATAAIIRSDEAINLTLECAVVADAMALSADAGARQLASGRYEIAGDAAIQAIIDRLCTGYLPPIPDADYADDATAAELQAVLDRMYADTAGEE